MTATNKKQINTYDVALWEGDIDDQLMWRNIERLQLRTTSNSESVVTRQAKFMLELKGVPHKRRTEGDHVILEMKDMFITIDTY